jgi:two-component system cell cycle response regulator
MTAGAVFAVGFAAPHAETVTPMATKILAVDDSKAIRMVIQGAFSTCDCDLSEAANGEEGLALAVREKPDLILLDITMPVMDGVAMLAALRRDPQLKKIPVIVMSAESSRENVANRARLGVNDYLAKPFKEQVLLDAVRKIVPLSQKEGRNHESTRRKG